MNRSSRLPLSHFPLHRSRGAVNVVMLFNGYLTNPFRLKAVAMTKSFHLRSKRPCNFVALILKYSGTARVTLVTNIRRTHSSWRLGNERVQLQACPVNYWLGQMWRTAFISNVYEIQCSPIWNGALKRWPLECGQQWLRQTYSSVSSSPALGQPKGNLVFDEQLALPKGS